MKLRLLIVMAALCAGTASFAGSPDGRVWQVTSKRCGAETLPMAQAETYQFKSGLLARVFVSLDSSERQCKSAIVYLRLLQSFGMADGAYSEQSLLQPNLVRTVCKNKIDGAPVSPPVSDETLPAPAGAPSLALELSAGTDSLSATVTGSDECPGAALQLEMSLAQ